MNINDFIFALNAATLDTFLPITKILNKEDKKIYEKERV